MHLSRFKGLLLLFLHFYAVNCFSQLAFPSLFPDVNSSNPGVIGSKETGILRYKYKTRIIRREQDIKRINGAEIQAEQEDILNLDKHNLFGGIQKKSYNTEWMLDYAKGNQGTDLASESQRINYDLNTWSYLGRYAFGANEGWGLSFQFVRHQSSFSFKSKNTNEAIGDNIKTDSIVPGLRIGKTFRGQNHSFGLIVEFNELTTRIESRRRQEAKSTLITVLGASAGFQGELGHFEVGLEADPFSDRVKGPLEDEAAPIPAKLTLVAEKKVRKFIFGYIGMLYQGRYIDPELIILTQLVHRNNLDGTRVQHLIKFSYGDFPKGLSVGASVYLSSAKSKERSSVYLGNEKHGTVTAGKGWGLSLSYSF